MLRTVITTIDRPAPELVERHRRGTLVLPVMRLGNSPVVDRQILHSFPR